MKFEEDYTLDWCCSACGRTNTVDQNILSKMLAGDMLWCENFRCDAGLRLPENGITLILKERTVRSSLRVINSCADL